MKKYYLTLIFLLIHSTITSASSLSQTKENSLIIYNNHIALVHEKRDLKVSKKDTQIIYEDVASSINTDSVNIKLPDSIQLLSQQYRYDKITLNKLLDAHIGKKIIFKEKTATLLSANASSAVIKLSNKKIVSVKSSDIAFNSIPKELLTKPSLVWNIKNTKNVNSTLELDYIINNISFKSDYILNLKKNKADLTGFVSIKNNSGKAFKNTQLHLLAGEINRANHARAYAKSMMVAEAPQDAVVEHQAFEGYHFYSIPFLVNLSNNETTQIKFIEIKNLDIQRSYSANMSNPIYLRGQRKQEVSQHIIFKSLKKPLPKGIVRSYSKLQKQTILIGENSISHTPKNAKIDLVIGKNFDTKVIQKILKRKESKYDLDLLINYELTNSSDETKKIELLIPFSNASKTKIKSSKKYKFANANTLTFMVEVKANSTQSFDVDYYLKK